MVGRSPTREGGRVAGTMDSRKTVRRQSGIELLRIIAMYLIVTHHMVNHNSFDFLGQPGSFRQVVLSLPVRSRENRHCPIFYRFGMVPVYRNGKPKECMSEDMGIGVRNSILEYRGVGVSTADKPRGCAFPAGDYGVLPNNHSAVVVYDLLCTVLDFLAIHQPKFAAYRAERAQEACRRYGRCLGSVVGNSIFIDGYRFEPYRLHVCLYVNYILSVVYAASVNQIRCRRCSYLRYIVAGVEYSFWIIVYR